MRLMVLRIVTGRTQNFT